MALPGIELLAQAVALIAGMAISEDERVAVRARVIADLTSPTTRIPQWSSREGEVLRSLPPQLEIRPPDPRVGAAPGLVMAGPVELHGIEPRRLGQPVE